MKGICYQAILNRAARMALYLFLLVSTTSYAENPFRTANPSKGHFILEYVTPKKPVYRDIETVFKSSGAFESIINSINHEFIFPENITVRFVQGEGPVYYPDQNTIQMSYEFIYYLTTLYLERYPKATDDEMLEFSLNTTIFLFYHEMAHAFIDIYELPIVSSEETAADNLAVILALEFSDDGFKMLIDSAELFDLLEQKDSNKVEESDYWDEHQLDAQRFYNILCMTYGKYPERVTKKLKNIGNKKLTEFIKERGDDCIYQYEQQVNAWSKLLNPYFKNY